MSIKAIIFDFDGVIVADSEYIKEDCWDAVVKELGEGARQPLLSARHKFANGKGSRYDIIKDALIVLNYQSEQIDGLVNHCAAVYNGAVQAGILKKGVWPADYESLRRMSLRYPLYINSATPEIAIKETVINLKLKEIFKGVYGQPNKKNDNICRAVSAEMIKPNELLFVGDSEGDYQAAEQVGCQFIGLANSWNKWGEQKPFPLIVNLAELETLLIKGGITRN